MLSVITDIARRVEQAGGRTFLVGGPVRDELLGQKIQDYDLEIFGLSGQQIHDIAATFGTVKEVGQIFGILKLRVGNHDIDIAAPRRERKTGPGHRGFDVNLDPTMTPADAARRRDFTINAMMRDVLTDELVDPFGGQQDLQQHILRPVDPTTFIEDPLRVLRAFVFAARFQLTTDDDTKNLLKSMLPSVRELPGDRLREEWIKLFMRAAEPSIGLQLAFDIGYFEPWPAIIKMKTTEQGHEVHPEGDVWIHTLMAVDRCRELVDRDEMSNDSALICLLAAFCHDFGKPATFRREGEEFTFHGHAQAGMRPASAFLISQGFPESTVETVAILVRDHMQIHELYESDRRAPITDGAIRRLLRKLHPATVQQLLTVGEADFLGRGPWIGRQGQEVWPKHHPRKHWFIDRLSRAKLTDDPPPIVQGRDLIALGWKPGPTFSPVIEAAETYAENTNATKEQILEIIRNAESPEAAVLRLQSSPAS